VFDYVAAVILGIVEGITEFLPVSSTGHLILVNQWVKLGGGESFEKMFDVVIQMGAILAVVIFFWNRLWPFGKSSQSESRSVWDTWFKVAVATVPAVIIGATVGKKVQELLFNPIVVACALVVWGGALIVIEKISKREKMPTVAQIGFSTAFLIGIIQCLAMVPGTSRSAATIIGAMILGASRLAAAEFSFFLAIPTLCAASVYSLYKYGAAMDTHLAIVLAIGFVVSFLVAYAVIRAFMKFIQRRNFIPFGYYRIALGALVLLYFLVIK